MSSHNCPFIYNYNIALHCYYNRDLYREALQPKASFSLDEAYKIGMLLGIDWNHSTFDVNQFRNGLDVELEHGLRSPLTNVTDDNPILTGKIALAHLNEFPDYYLRLQKLEDEAKTYWESEKKLV